MCTRPSTSTHSSVARYGPWDESTPLSGRPTPCTATVCAPQGSVERLYPGVLVGAHRDAATSGARAETVGGCTIAATADVCSARLSALGACRKAAAVRAASIVMSVGVTPAARRESLTNQTNGATA